MDIEATIPAHKEVTDQRQVERKNARPSLNPYCVPDTLIRDLVYNRFNCPTIL